MVTRVFLNPSDNSITGRYTSEKDIVCVCDTTSAFSVTLPDYSIVYDKIFRFYNVGDNDLTIRSIDGQLFKSGYSYHTLAPGKSITVISDIVSGYLVLDTQTYRYKDIVLPIQPRTTGAGKPTLASFFGNINEYTMSVNDVTELDNSELIHEWVEGSTIEIHVHFANDGVDATDRAVKWEIDYTWANMYSIGNNTAFPAYTRISKEAVIPANTPDKTHFYTSVGTFTPENGKYGGYLLMSLKRIASIGAAPTNDPWVLAAGAHVKCDDIGSEFILE